jgi:hypothetical protein
MATKEMLEQIYKQGYEDGKRYAELKRLNICKHNTAMIITPKRGSRYKQCVDCGAIIGFVGE